MRVKLIMLFCGVFLLSSTAAAVEPNTPAQDTVKMLHLFIQADVNEIRFENIWVFERQSAKRPWQVSINLPDVAENIILDEPNRATFTEDTKIIRANLAADLAVDSVGFSYTLANRGGECRTFIKPDYKVNSVIVSAAGRATGLASEILKPNKFLASHSNAFSRIYSAYDLAVGTKIEINLTGLPCRSSQVFEIVCILGLEAIIIAALLTLLYYNLKGKRRLSR